MMTFRASYPGNPMKKATLEGENCFE